MFAVTARSNSTSHVPSPVWVIDTIVAEGGLGKGATRADELPSLIVRDVHVCRGDGVREGRDVAAPHLGDDCGANDCLAHQGSGSDGVREISPDQDRLIESERDVRCARGRHGAGEVVRDWELALAQLATARTVDLGGGKCHGCSFEALRPVLCT